MRFVEIEVFGVYVARIWMTLVAEESRASQETSADGGAPLLHQSNRELIE
jgi:hypothetical protein